MDSAGIDYHVSLMANAFQKCLDVPELQPELLCALVKQTTPHIIPHSKGHTGQSSSGGGVQVKRQHSIKHPRVSRFICFQVSPGNYRSNHFLLKHYEIINYKLKIYHLFIAMFYDIFKTNVLLNCCLCFLPVFHVLHKR